MLKIRGHSLYPDFLDGDFVLAAGVPFPSGRIRVGDMVIFHQPGYAMMIKRVNKVLANGEAFDVRGTQVDSTDSRNFGAVPRERIAGKVIWHIRQRPSLQG